MSKEEKNNKEENGMSWESIKNIVYGWNTETNEPSGIEIIPDDPEEVEEKEDETEPEYFSYILESDSLIC